MRLHRPSVPAIGLLLATFGLVAACGTSAGAPTPPTTVATTPATTAAAPSAAAPTTGSGVEPVNCGPVGPSGGAQVELIADVTPAGRRVGCTEAINVITDYYRDAAKAEGTGRHLVVQGWACSADTGAYGSGSIGCERDGFAFHTEP